MPSWVSAVIIKSFDKVFLSTIRLWYLVATKVLGRLFKIPFLLENILLVFPWTKFFAWMILDPKTCPIIWWPRQTPRIGIFLYSFFTISRQFPAWSGFPGPGEITIFLYFF